MNTTVRRLMLATASLAAIATLAACSSAPRPNAQGAAVKELESAVMTPAGNAEVDKITWNVWMGEPQSIDPFMSADNTPNMINSNMCETLLVQTPDYTIEPNLAKSFSNPDPLHWVYELRDDVTFWDGTPMTAEDVAWSLNHNLTDPTTMYNYLFSRVSKVEVTGEHEVTVTLKEPDYVFNHEMADFAGVVAKKDYYAQHPKEVGTPSGGIMCTGPYQFTKWNRGESIIADRYDGYWNTELKPKVKEIEFTFLQDNSTITSALLSGQIDGAYAVPISGVGQLAAAKNGKLYIGDSPLNQALNYSRADGPMSDLRMRQALQMAIDWQGISDSVFQGTAEPAKLQTPPAVYGFAKEWLDAYAATLPEPVSADYDGAKKLLADVPASIKDQEILMTVPDNKQQFGVAIKDAADRIGLKMKLQVVPTGDFPNYVNDDETRGDTDILWTEWWPGTPDPLDWLNPTATKNGFINKYGYDGIDSLFAKAMGTADDAERADLVVEMEKQLHEDLLPVTPGVEVKSTIWMNNRISGAPATFSYVYFPWAAYLGGTE